MIYLVWPDDPLTCGIIGIMAIGSILKAFTVIVHWFRSQVTSKHTVLARNAAQCLTMTAVVVLVVRGALYNVTARDAEALDHYEGVPVYYHRITVFVKDGDGKLHRALAYKTRNDVMDAAPSLSYVLTIVCGCRDWRIEPDDEVKTAMDAGLAAPEGGE